MLGTVLVAEIGLESAVVDPAAVPGASAERDEMGAEAVGQDPPSSSGSRW